MRKEIPRSPRTIAKKQLNNQTTAAPSTGWFLRYGPLVISGVGVAISVFSLVISFTQNGPAILRNAQAAMRWYRTDHELTGFWTNDGEGIIDAQDWTTSTDDAVAFNLVVERGKVSGESTSNRFCKFSPYSRLGVDGVASGDRIDAMLYDYIGGKKVVFAVLQMVADRKRNVLTISPINQPAAMLPASFKLSKWAQPDPSMNPHLCLDFLSESAKRAEKLEQGKKQNTPSPSQ
ncbi:hypothetical protein [Paraburkholderia dinghuensis]|uniref:Uncharacterized protein n=1 Tax=Paraburkholderia dinghuensis TaxID=2305225 RepID=A0A3N6MZZ6_9BURK|nr:hypothetical protein [Paraburkholderia dinghuensis]RQH09598.1 hypothetical protein D1Y85_00045 [Paraburkholderia dinghuensis]